MQRSLVLLLRLLRVVISLLSNQSLLSEPCAWELKMHEIGSLIGVDCMLYSLPTFKPNQWRLTFWPDQYDYHVAVQVMTGCYCYFVCLHSYNSFVQRHLKIKSLEMFLSKHILINTKIALDWNNWFCICHLWEFRYGLIIIFLFQDFKKWS